MTKINGTYRGAFKELIQTGSIKIYPVEIKASTNKVKKCENCPVLIKHGKYCIPCSDEVQREKKRVSKLSFW